MREAASDEEVAAALALRERVFVVEQNVAPSADRDGRDDEAVHVVALDGPVVVGTCRLVFDAGVARLGRLAVEPALRGRGTGSAILEAAEQSAALRGARRVRLHAQLAARSLYDRAGYEAQGDVFLEEGIEHVTMERALA